MRIGTHGKIRAKKVGEAWIADARVRDNDGVVRQVRRTGPSKDAVVAALRAAIAARPGFSEDTIPRRPFVNTRRLVSSTRSRPHVLYRFFDAADELLYVGISLHGIRRMSDHQRSKPWWPSVARTSLEHFPDRESAREAERAAIVRENPRYNIAA
jgi:hypothetical protein